MDATLVVTAIGLALSGVFIGFCSGLLGIGGGTLMVPLLRVVFNLPAIGATATSLFVIVPTSISGTITHISQKTCLPKLSIALGIGGAITSSLGVYLATLSPSWLIMLAAAFVILYSAINMLRKARKVRARTDNYAQKTREKSINAINQASASVTPNATDQPKTSALSDITDQPETSALPEDFPLSVKTLAGGFGIGLIAGLLSGYVGVGGGFIMVPLMCSLLHVPIHKATGSSLLAIIILAIPSVVSYCALGNVNYLAACMLTVGSIPGAVLGSKLAPKVPEQKLCYLFAVFLGIAAVVMLVKECGLMG